MLEKVLKIKDFYPLLRCSNTTHSTCADRYYLYYGTKRKGLRLGLNYGTKFITKLSNSCDNSNIQEPFGSFIKFIK